MTIVWLNYKHKIWVNKRQKWASFNYDFYDSGLCLTTDTFHALMRLTWEYRLLYGVCGLSAVGQTSGYYAKIPVEHADDFVEKATAILLDEQSLSPEGKAGKPIGATLFHGNSITKKQGDFQRLLAKNPELLSRYIDSRMGV